MATLKSVFPTWQNMWAGYSQNYMEEFYANTLGKKAIHILVLHSAYNYWKNDEFEDDEESSIDKLMTLIRAKATRLSQTQVLYQNIYEKLKLPTGDYQKLQEVTRDDLSPFYRKNIYPSQNITKSGDVQYQGLQYSSHTGERVHKPQQIGISDGVRRQINQTTFNKYYPIDKNWIARMLHSFPEAGIDLESTVQELHPIFCRVYPFELGDYSYDETAKEYKWKSKRSQEEIEVDLDTGQPLDDESLRDIDEPEYNQWKADNKPGLKPTWYLEGTYRFLGRLKKELKKLSGTSKQKQEQRIEATEKLIKIYEKDYSNPTLDFFFDKLNEMEGYEEYKNIVGNYFVNLLNPTTVPFRPLSFILVGPPGTGKSAIAAKTAEASERAFIRVSMNGQAEPTYLKGREIAYGGADQGKILKEILTKGSSRPVILIDELTRAGSKALTDIIGTMTDPDQNAFAFEDDWLKWKIDLSQAVFIIADNHIEKIDPFLLSRSSVVNISILPYEKRVELVKKKSNKILDGENETKRYVDKITDDFCKYIITEEWGIRQTLANINNLFLGLRAYVLMNDPIADLNDVKETKEETTAYTLLYENGQKITLVRAHDEDKGLDGIVHNVFTDISDWPKATPHDEQEERKKITILDLSSQGLYEFDFTRYPELDTLDVSDNNFKKFDLSSNVKLKYLNISNNTSLAFKLIIFKDNKQSLEELYFINIYESNNSIDLSEFSNLKKISYSWQIHSVYLDKSLKGKVKGIYRSWQELDEDEQLAFQNRYRGSIYEDMMRDKVRYK